ncbi:MAG: hypothetical protein COA80_12920 [Leeuwenhoekiella sp.]|nr:MAG: hypothetical protein COA80_12920 [Leeuwenhoekiella sp.]
MESKNLIFVFGLLIFSSCATVKFYNDANLTQESGIEFYQPKPYLLVERKPSKDVALKSSIIYLPDLTKPKYAKLKAGFGSNDLKLSLSNGIITSYGITTDSKVPETITALTGVLSATGTTYKSFAEAIDLLSGEDETETEPVEEAGDKTSMQKAKVILDAVIIDLNGIKDSELLTTNQKNEIKKALGILNQQVTEINKLFVTQIPSIVVEINKAVKILSEIKVSSESDNAKDFKDKLSRNLKEIDKTVELMQPKKKVAAPTFELYEIIISNGNTTLKKVLLPK